MISNLFKISFFLVLIKWIKPRIKSLLWTSIPLIIVLYLHSEYVSWSIASENIEYLGISYVVKNIVIFVLVVIILYFLTKKFTNKNSETLEHLKEREMIRNSENPHHEIIEKLRNKEKLETRSEKILNKNK
ncbi:hypothetical protein OAQ08_05805 [Alphaproteobacteria bacterium]|nr:hypothetical protein [Alphaproteobacteria bacterium]